MQKNDIEDLIMRQSEGKLSADELKELKEWYLASEENRKKYADYCALLRAQQTVHNERLFAGSVDEAWQRTRRRMRRARFIAIGSNWRTWAAAAVAALVIGFGAGRMTGTHADGDKTTTVFVPNGAKTHITLPDGTSVWLNAASRLSYSASYGKQDRNVVLDGEAYFDVTHNADMPFTVRAAKADVKVLGTRFNIKAYSEDSSSRITLIEGSLSVSTTGKAGASAGTPTVIRPGQQAVITGTSKAIKVHSVKATDYALWATPERENPATTQGSADSRLPNMREPAQNMRRTLFFDEESLTQIASDLSRAFNVSIVIEGNAGKGVYYGDFRNGESLFQILDAITSESDLTYKVQDNMVILK